MNKATVFGASGLTGNLLTHMLLQHPDFSEVKIAVRRPLNMHNEKLQQLVIDYNQLHAHTDLFSSDHIFCCLGTTMKKQKGNKATYTIVDKGYPVEIARQSALHNCKSLHVMSSMGANENSMLFYARLKGEMQSDVIRTWKEKFTSAGLYIYQPGMLEGKRNESRTGESIGKIMMRIFNPILKGPLKKYHSIKAADVARVMLHNSLHITAGLQILKNDELLDLAKKVQD